MPLSLRTIAPLHVILYLLTATMVSTEPVTIQSVYDMAYVTLDESTLFIHGGRADPELHGGIGEVKSQFFSLDLTRSWKTSEAPWTPFYYPDELTIKSPPTGHSMTLSQDGRTLVFWITNPTAVISYGFDSSIKWSYYMSKYSIQDDKYNLHAAADPTTGLTYIPGGGPDNWNNVVEVDLNGRTNTSSIPSTLFTAQPYYSFVWSQYRQTFIYYGGNTSNSNPFFEFAPKTKTWSQLQSSGSIPPFRSRSCMVPAYNGAKMILFGGDNGGPSVANLYILDVKNMSWTEGQSASDARSSMACSVAGDNFIVWGGSKLNPPAVDVGVSVAPLVYDMSAGKWTETFVRLSFPTPTASGNSPNDGEGEEDGGGGGGGATGGILGFLAVVIVAVFVKYVLVKRQRRENKNGPVEAEDLEATSQFDQDIVSEENATAAQEFSMIVASKASLEQSSPKSPQYIYKKELPSPPSSPSSISESPQTAPPSPEPSSEPSSPTPVPRPRVSFASIDSSEDEADAQPVQHPHPLIQGHVVIPSSNPQYDPTVARTLSSSTARNPHRPIGRNPHSIVFSTSDLDLQEQLNRIQAELDRRQATRDVIEKE